MSGTQFDALPFDEGRRWKLLEGELVEAPSPTPRHQRIVVRILLILERHLSTVGNHGLVFPDTEYALSDQDRLRPDISVLLAEKASRLDPDRIPIPGAPDIAIEVISPTERAIESHEKVRAYLLNGTAEVYYPVLLHRYLYSLNRVLRISCWAWGYNHNRKATPCQTRLTAEISLRKQPEPVQPSPLHPRHLPPGAPRKHPAA